MKIQTCVMHLRGNRVFAEVRNSITCASVTVAHPTVNQFHIHIFVPTHRVSRNTASFYFLFFRKLSRPTVLGFAQIAPTAAVQCGLIT